MLLLGTTALKQKKKHFTLNYVWITEINFIFFYYFINSFFSLLFIPHRFETHKKYDECVHIEIYENKKKWANICEVNLSSGKLNKHLCLNKTEYLYVKFPFKLHTKCDKEMNNTQGYNMF